MLSTGACLYAFEEISEPADDRVAGASDIPALLAGDGYRAARGRVRGHRSERRECIPVRGIGGDHRVGAGRACPRPEADDGAGRRAARADRLRRAEAKPERSAVAAGVPHRAGEVGPAGNARGGGADRGGLGCTDQLQRARGASKIAASAPRRASRPVKLTSGPPARTRYQRPTHTRESCCRRRTTHADRHLPRVAGAPEHIQASPSGGSRSPVTHLVRTQQVLVIPSFTRPSRVTTPV